MQTRERHTEYMRDWRLKNPTKVKESRQRWKKQNPLAAKKYARAYRKSDKGKFQKYKNRANKLGLVFEITQEKFIELIHSPCHYCGHSKTPVGVDRKNNNKGYLKSNSLPCCWRCNRFKGSMEYKNFIENCHQISEHLHRL